MKFNFYYFIKLSLRVFGVLVFLLSALIYLDTTNFYSNALRTQGKVVGVEKTAFTPGIVSVVQFKNSANNLEQIKSTACYLKDNLIAGCPQIGNDVELYYDQNNPKNARIMKIYNNKIIYNYEQRETVSWIYIGLFGMAIIALSFSSLLHGITKRSSFT